MVRRGSPREVYLIEYAIASLLRYILQFDTPAHIDLIELHCRNVEEAIKTADAIPSKQAMKHHLSALDHLELSVALSRKFKRLADPDALKRAADLLAPSYKS